MQFNSSGLTKAIHIMTLRELLVIIKKQKAIDLMNRVQRILMWIVFTLSLVMFLIQLFNGGPGLIITMFGLMTFVMAFVILSTNKE